MRTMRWLTVLIASCVSPVTPAALAQGSAPTPPPWRVVHVTAGIYEFICGENTSMFVVTPAGVIVTDPIAQRHPEIARLYLAQIRKITAAPIRYLIYSHSHFSRTAGGQVFKDAGAVVIAQRHARDRLLRVTTPEIVPVDQVVDDHRTITLGGTTLELYYFGRSHSNNMLTMLLPAERIVYTVDWLGPDAPHVGGLGGDSWMPEWEAGARRVLALPWDRMIPGHGPRIGTKANVAMNIDYFEDAKTLARTMADHDRCTLHDYVAPPAPIPAKYRAYTDQVSWDAVLNRYCVFWNQGY